MGPQTRLRFWGSNKIAGYWKNLDSRLSSGNWIQFCNRILKLWERSADLSFLGFFVGSDLNFDFIDFIDWATEFCCLSAWWHRINALSCVEVLPELMFWPRIHVAFDKHPPVRILPSVEGFLRNLTQRFFANMPGKCMRKVGCRRSFFGVSLILPNECNRDLLRNWTFLNDLILLPAVEC